MGSFSCVARKRSFRILISCVVCSIKQACSTCRDVWTRRRKEEAAQGAQEGRQGPRRGRPQVQAETKGAGEGPEGRGRGRLEKGPDGRGRHQEEREKVKPFRLTGQKMDEGAPSPSPLFSMVSTQNPE